MIIGHISDVALHRATANYWDGCHSGQLSLAIPPYR